MTNEEWIVPTPEAVERIKRMTLARVADERRRPARRLLWIAAAVVCVALAGSLAFGPDQVLAAGKRLLAYVPGFGIRPVAEVRLSAAGPVQAEHGNKRVEVWGLMADGQSTTVFLSTKGFALEKAAVQLLDASGHPLTAKVEYLATAYGNLMQSDDWLTFPGTADPNLRQVTVVVHGDEEWRLTVPLVPGAHLIPPEQFGPSDTTQGYTVAARVAAHSGRTDVTLLVQGVDQSASFSGPDRVLLTANGWNDSITSWMHTGETELWNLQSGALPDSVQQATVTIPALKVIEPVKAPVKLPICTCELNRTVQLGTWPILLRRAELTGNQLKVYVDLGPTSTLRYVEDLQIKGPFPGSKAQSNPTTKQFEWIQFQVPNGAKTVDLTLQNPKVVLQGPWVMQVPVQREP